VSAPGFRLLVVPYEIGRLRKGVGRGPDRLLEGGAEEALASGGASVQREVIELDWDFNERSGSGEDAAAFELMGMVSEGVQAARADGAFPVILSGSCSLAAVGTVAGLDEGSPGVVWLDAHSDFNTPETTVEGYLDGMGMSILTGGSWRAMAAAIPGHRAVPETAAMLVGARDFDDLERAHLDRSEVALVEPGRLRDPEQLLAAIGRLRPKPSGLYLHVDLDVLDAGEATVNVYSAPGGVSADELEALVAAVLGEGQVRALSLTAYDPERDPEGRVPPIAVRLLGALAGAAA
jgi:arginase